MKTSLRLITVLVCLTLLSGLQGCKMKQKRTPSQSSSTEELYYGLTAKEILSMSDDDSESFRIEKNIDVVKWEIMRLNLKTKKNNQEAEVKERKAKEINDRVDKKLGIK